MSGSSPTRDLRRALSEAARLLREGSAAPAETLPPSLVLRALGLPDGPRATGGDLAARPEPKDAPLPKLSRFHALREIGRGGMGRVLEASDPELGRPVAIKVIVEPGRVSDAELGRFVAEAQVTSQLQHPNIVPVYDVGVSEAGEFFFVMKRVEGRSLGEVLQAQRRGDPELLASWSRHRLLVAFVQVCQAIAYAHGRGVLHRDLKPANVLLGDYGEVLVADWGVARRLGEPEAEALELEPLSASALQPLDEAARALPAATLARTLDGLAIGTPGYMSPEQASGELAKLDPRSDVWSLGAILYEILTLQPAIPPGDPLSMLFATMQGPPTDPRERTPDRRIDGEIAELCLRAMARQPGSRFAGARELAAALEAHLEGSRRRDAARQRLAEAEQLHERYRALADEREALDLKDADLSWGVEPWTPVDEKRELLALRERRDELEPERSSVFSDLVMALERALSHDPGMPEARQLMAQVCWDRFLEVEEKGDEAAARFLAGRAREYGGPLVAEWIRGAGALTLHSEPPGARAVLWSVERRGLRWPLVQPRELGTTPLRSVPLEMGSYVVTLRKDGFRDTIYPLWIGRSRHWDSGPEPVRLLRDDEIGKDFHYIPGGPFRCGGDPDAPGSRPASEEWVDGFLLARLPLTVGEYLDFVNALHERDPDEAWRRVPRRQSAAGGPVGQYWLRAPPGQPYVLPERDVDGDRWDTRWPVLSLSWEDATAYCDWRSARDGVKYRLPRDLEWEKAARGVDGRLHPWGDRFDATLCKMRDSRPGRPTPEPVGSYPGDESIYGVRDMAGSMRDWCGDLEYDGDPKRRIVRGGGWQSWPRAARCATRSAIEPYDVFPTYGFRLAKDLP
jgi:serine/threonine-protein kinase